MKNIQHLSRSSFNKVQASHGFQFKIYDSGFENRRYSNAREFLQQAFHLVFVNDNYIDETFTVMKVQYANKKIYLTVSCDYFEVFEKKGNKTLHLDSWQSTSMFEGYSLHDLVAYVASLATNTTQD